MKLVERSEIEALSHSLLLLSAHERALVLSLFAELIERRALNSAPYPWTVSVDFAEERPSESGNVRFTPSVEDLDSTAARIFDRVTASGDQPHRRLTIGAYELRAPFDGSQWQILYGDNYCDLCALNYVFLKSFLHDAGFPRGDCDCTSCIDSWLDEVWERQQMDTARAMVKEDDQVGLSRRPAKLNLLPDDGGDEPRKFPPLPLATERWKAKYSPETLKLILETFAFNADDQAYVLLCQGDGLKRDQVSGIVGYPKYREIIEWLRGQSAVAKQIYLSDMLRINKSRPGCEGSSS